MNGKRAIEQTETRLAAPVYLTDALHNLGLLIWTAEDWIRPADLPGLIEAIEKQIRALTGFMVSYLENHPAALTEASPETVRVLQVELAELWKNLDSLDQLRAKQSSATTDFVSEAEELRKLRSGELKAAPPSDSKRPQP